MDLIFTDLVAVCTDGSYRVMWDDLAGTRRSPRLAKQSVMLFSVFFMVNTLDVSP